MKPTKTTEAKAANYYSIIKSPINDLMLVADETALIGIYFVGCDHVPTASRSWMANDRHPVLKQTTKELQEYFAGKRERFGIPIRLIGTDFQRKIWEQIAVIPYGETITYSELAKRAGAPEAVRAAGTTTGRNPISIIVPCHRVIGKDGGLCGFAGGLDRKRHLLKIENSGAASIREFAVNRPAAKVSA